MVSGHNGDMFTALAPDVTGTSPLLSVSDVAVSYGPVRALDGVSLTVGEGEIVALAGENGAGKTTLVRCIGGDIEPTTGSIRVAGKVMPADPSVLSRHGVGVVWQDLALCDNLDIAANLMLGRERRRQLRSEVRMHTDAMRLLERLGVPLHDTTRSVRSLSGGQRQLVAVARAMAAAPRMLLLDEPTAALGVQMSAQVEEHDLPDAGVGHRDLAGLPRHRPDVPAGRPHRGAAARPGGGRGHARPRCTRTTWSRCCPARQLDSSARRQLTRLHGLADRLVSADPSSSLSLILSALGAALGSERLCIHLRAEDGLVCSAALGLPPRAARGLVPAAAARRAGRSAWPRRPRRRSSPTTRGPG